MTTNNPLSSKAIFFFENEGKLKTFLDKQKLNISLARSILQETLKKVLWAKNKDSEQ